MNNELVLLNELKARTTRLESRLVQLGDYVGANLRLQTRVNVKTGAFGDICVEVDALDVSVSRIARSLRENGIFTGAIPVLLKGQRIMVVDLAQITN